MANYWNIIILIRSSNLSYLNWHWSTRTKIAASALLLLACIENQQRWHQQFPSRKTDLSAPMKEKQSVARHPETLLDMYKEDGVWTGNVECLSWWSMSAMLNINFSQQLFSTHTKKVMPKEFSRAILCLINFHACTYINKYTCFSFLSPLNLNSNCLFETTWLKIFDNFALHKIHLQISAYM